MKRSSLFWKRLVQSKFIASVLCCIFASSLFAAPADAEDKIYVSKDVIELTDEGMCINMEGHSVDSVHCDEGGYYFVIGELISKSGYIQSMYCRECKRSWPVGMGTSRCPRGHKF